MKGKVEVAEIIGHVECFSCNCFEIETADSKNDFENILKNRGWKVGYLQGEEIWYCQKCIDKYLQP